MEVELEVEVDTKEATGQTKVEAKAAMEEAAAADHHTQAHRTEAG